MTNDDVNLRSYQDDLDDDNKPDPFMDEAGDHPADELGIPEEEFKKELDKEEIDDLDDDEYPADIDARDDEREYIEDLDKDDDDRSYR